MNHILRCSVEHFCAECIGLKKTPRTDLKGEIKELFRNNRISTDELIVTLYDISSSRIMEEIKGIHDNMLFFKYVHERLERHTEILDD